MPNFLPNRVSSCSLFRKKGTDDSIIKNESNVSGSSEKLDGSPLNMGATGSDSGSVDGLSSVFFEYDSATLATTEKEKIAANAAKASLMEYFEMPMFTYNPMSIIELHLI